MPWKSKKQMRYFYAMKNKGEFSPEMVEKWKSHTPNIKDLPESAEKKASMKHFWSGFEKRAVENYVAAQPAMDYPGAPEKMLKWNEKGGVDPRSPEELQAAQAASMVTLPPEVEGATCATCMHFRPLTQSLGHGFCTNPEIKMDVTENMHCAHWQNPDAHDPVAAAEDEAQMQEAEQAAAAQQGMSPDGSPLQSSPNGGAGMPSQPGQTQMSPQDQQALQAGASGGASTTPEGSMDGGQPFKPSPVANESGFPQGQQTSQNPMVEQAVQDFQGAGTTGGPTGGDGGDVGSAKPKKSSPKKSDSKKSDSKKTEDKGSTINIHVGKEKTAKVNFWKGIVEGF